MTKQVQLRRGTTAEHAIFTGAEGELTIDTTLDIAVVHDGSSVGGHPLVGAAATQQITNKTGVGIGTSSIQNDYELRVIGDTVVKGDVNARSVTVRYEEPPSRSGIITGTPSDIISGIATNNIRVGYAVSGTYIAVGSSVASIGIGFVGLTTLTQDFTTQTTAKFLTSNGDTLVSIASTNAITIGYAVTLPGNILSDTIVTGVGGTDALLDPYYLVISQNSTGTLGISTRSCTVLDGVSDIGYSTVTGLDTTGLQVGDEVESEFISSSPTTIVSLASTVVPGGVEISSGISTFGAGIPLTFSRTVTLTFINPGFTTEFAFVDQKMGQVNADVLNVNQAVIQRLNLTELNGGNLNLSETNTNVALVNQGFTTTAYINAGNINVGIATTMIVDNNYMNVGIATTMVVAASNVDLAYINVGIGTTVGISSARLDEAYISVGIGTTVGISSARLDDAFVSSGLATYFNVSGFTTIANYVNGVPDPNSNVTIGLGRPYNIHVVAGTLGTSYTGVGTEFIAGVGTDTITGIDTNRIVRSIESLGIATEYSDGTYVSVASTSSGSGVGARFNLEISNNDILSINVERGGRGYLIGDVIYLDAAASGVGLTPPTLGLSSTKSIVVAGVSTLVVGNRLAGENLLPGTVISGVGTNEVTINQFSTNTEVVPLQTFESASRSTINLDVTGNARVTGILTVGVSSITLNGGNSSVSGIEHLTATEINALQRIVVNNPLSVVYQGTLAVGNTNYISGVATDGVQVGYAVTNEYLPTGTEVVSIGNSSVEISRFALNTVPIQTTNGYIETINGDKIAGVTTNNIRVGSAVSGEYVGSGVTVINIGIGSVTVSVASSEPYGESIYQGTLASTGVSTITGIATANIDIGHVIIAPTYILAGTTVAGIGVSSITLSQAATNVGIQTQSYVFRRVSEYVFTYEEGAVITQDFYFEDSVSGISTIPSLKGKNANFTGIGSFDTVIARRTIITSDLTVNNFVVPGISTLNQIEVASGIVTELSGTNIEYTGIATLGNVRIGAGQTTFIVDGNGRLTGILTVGLTSTTDGMTIDGRFDAIHGVKDLQVDSGIATNLTGSNLNYTGIQTFNDTSLTELSFVGVNTYTGLDQTVTFQQSRVAIATNYTLTLPPNPGRDGMSLIVDGFGNLGFSTNPGGLYENRLYVSGANGNDNDDGKTKPVKTLKRAAQLASFESFVLPGAEYLDGAKLLKANREFIQEEVVGFITATFPGFSTALDWDREICKRDVGYIVDAIEYDLTYNGNSKSVEAGLAYYSGIGTNYVDGEKTETIAGFNHIVNLSKYVINNVSVAGPSGIYNDARTLLLLNKDFIAAEAVGFITATYPSLLSNPDYDRTKCLRDMGHIIEAVSYDLSFGGNTKTVGAGVSYWTGTNNSVSGEVTETIAAFQYIYEISPYVINNVGVPTHYQTGVAGTVSQAFDSSIAFDSTCSPSAYSSNCCASVQSAIVNLVGIVTSIVGSGTSTTVSGLEYTATSGIATVTLDSSLGITTGSRFKLSGLTMSCDSYTTNDINITNVDYNEVVGICTITLDANHGLSPDDTVKLEGIEFSCDSEHAGISTTIFPTPLHNNNALYGTYDVFRCVDGTFGTQIVVNCGVSTIAHTYVSGGTATPGITTTTFPYPVDPYGSSPYGDTFTATSVDGNVITFAAGISTIAHTYVSGGTAIFGNAAPVVVSPTGNFQNTVGQAFDFEVVYDVTCSGYANSYHESCCANVQSTISNLVGIITTIVGVGTTSAPEVIAPTAKSTPVAIIVEAGEYVEDNPIILYEDIAVLGDNLRNTIIRPGNAGKDLLRVRNGCYLTGFAMKDYVDGAGVPQYTFDNAVAFDDPSDPFVSREGYAVKTGKSIITRSPYIQNCSILSFLGGNGMLVDGSKVLSPNIPIIPEEAEINPDLVQPEQGKSMVAAAFTMVSFGGIGWRVINDGYSQVVSCFQIFCRYGSLAQSGGYLSITNSATNFGFYALRSTGFSQNSFIFDRSRIAATGTSGGLQTLRVVGVGRSDQDLYVCRFYDNNNNDSTNLFKPLLVTSEFNAAVGVDTNTETINITAHPFSQGDSVVYFGDEQAVPPRIIGGLVNQNQYFVQYVDTNSFKLYEDDSFSRLVDLTSVSTGIHTFTKNNQEFFVKEIIDSHNNYQRVSLASTTDTIRFVSGREVTQNVSGGQAVGYAYTYNSTSRELVVSVEEAAGIRRNFQITGGSNGVISDHSPVPIGIAVTNVAGISSYWSLEFKVDSTDPGTTITGIANLPEDYKLHFHRPSIINSSSHTWEYSGSGIDYNALPQNGGRTVASSEQVSELGGRVYSSGTNELGDFKIGDFITAYNRTGNIIFNNTVTIGTLDSIRLSLSGGVQIEEFSVDAGLGDNELGGPQDKRVSTQLAVRAFLNNRLGSFIDKTVSTNAVPNSVVQLNSIGQINADLIPPKVVNYYRTIYEGGKTSLANRIPAADIQSGDTVVEPTNAYVLISDLISQYIILDNSGTYNFSNGDTIRGTVSQGGAIGIITAPTYFSGNIGYGTTGLVKGVSLNLNTLAGGSGYTSAGIYSGVQALRTTGIGTGMSLTITVSAGGTVSQVAIETGGRYYNGGDYVTVAPASIGGRSGGSDFTVRVGTVETRLYVSLTNNQKFQGSTSLPDYISDSTAVAISTNVGLAVTTTFTGTGIDVGGAVDFTNDRIVIGDNSIFGDGDAVRYYSTGNEVGPLVLLDTYWVKKVGLSSVELYDSYALSSRVNLQSSGTGSHTLTRLGINTSTDQITFVNHGFAQGDPVQVTSPGSLPTGITTDSFYFIGSRTDNTFTLHLTRSDSLLSANGLLYNAIDIEAVNGAGIVSFTKQNITYTSTVNTSSTDENNWALLATNTVDAANIVSGIIAPSRLGNGTANNQTFLRGDSSYQKVVMSVGIGTTQPIGVTATSVDFAPSGVGINTYYGNVNITLNRVQTTVDLYSTLGVSKFKSSTFLIGSDGEVQIKSAAGGGDVDASTFGGNAPAYYLDINNIQGNIPITRGGTGLQALPSAGAILIGNGSSYNLTTTPTFTGDVAFGGGSGAITLNANGDITMSSGATWSGEKSFKIQAYSNNLYLQYTTNLYMRNSGGSNRFTLDTSGNMTVSGTVTGTRLISNVANGTAPLSVTSSTVVTNLNADLLDGLQLHTGTNNLANRVVRTDGNGYIQSGLINTSSGELGDWGNGTVRYTASNDSYLRYLSRNSIKVQLGLSGKYDVDRRDYTTDSNYFTGVMGWSSTNLNSIFDWGSGFFDSWSNPANQPSGTSHWVGVQAAHYTNSSNRYGWQMVVGSGDPSLTYIRGTWGSSFTSWRKMWNDGNDGSGSGLDADTVDGYGTSTGRGGNTVAVRDSSAGLTAAYFTPGINGSNSGNVRSSYPYAFGFQESGGWSGSLPDLVLQYHTGVTLAANASYEGIRFKNDYNSDTVRFQINGGSNYNYSFNWLRTDPGIYNATNGANFYVNTSTSYCPWYCAGARGGYYGLAFNAGNLPHVMFDGSGNGGFYHQTGGRWPVYYQYANNCLAVCGSTTSATYELYVSGDIYATGTITAASDLRLKTNINTIENALEKVLALRGVTYEWDLTKAKGRKEGVKMGVIAQEVEPIIPEVVTYAADVDEYSVEYGNMTALLIEAVKEQQQIINTMRAEIETLKLKLGE